MGHCTYICNRLDWTCFSLGKGLSVNTEDFRDLCVMALNNEVTYTEFLDLSHEFLKYFEEYKIRCLYEYIQSIPKEHYRHVYHEDQLTVGTFDVHGEKRCLYQINSLYKNEMVWIFGGSFYLPKEPKPEYELE